MSKTGFFKTLPKVILFGCLIWMAYACSTRKNTFINRNFHSLTAYYNIYWNGNETYKELLEQIKGFGYDNYSSILNVFEYGTLADTATTNVRTDRMLEKASKAIAKHSMNIRGVEYVFVMKDAYMMVGRAHFFKHSYSMARIGFNFVINQYPKDPIRYEAQLWAARAYICEGEYDMAAPLLAQVRNHERILLKETYRDLPLVMAQYHIDQENYEAAVGFLLEGIARAKSRDMKNRLNFILGQIYQRQNNLREAFKFYRYVTRHNAPLELDYNARLNMALCFDRNYADRDDILRSLNRLLRDEKNSKYFGRIYFVLAEMSLREKNVKEATQYLEKSVSYAAADRDQLVISATKLADIYFALNDYEKAQPHYKTALGVMAEDHPDYFRVQVRAENLTALIQYLEVIRKEEIGLTLLSLSLNDREKAADSMAKIYVAESAAKKVVAPTQTTAAAQPKSNWYFYNEQARSFGYNEFARKWGRRNLEDLWFLQDKPALFMRQDIQEIQKPEETKQTAENLANAQNPAHKGFYLAMIPKNDAEEEAAWKRHEEALFHLGTGYFDLVEETKLGIETLEKLLKYYPDTEYKLQAYYYLYRMHMVDNNEAGKQKYRDLLVKEFPDNDLTRLVTDPNFAKSRENNAEKAQQLYEYTFIAYMGGSYEAVLANIQEARRKYPGNAQLAKFRFLEAMSMGAEGGSPKIIEELEKLITEFPNDAAVIELAKSTIEFHKNLKPLTAQDLLAAQQAEMGLRNNDLKVETTDSAKLKSTYDISMYKAYEPATPHYALLFVKTATVDANVIKTKLADFNRRNYLDDKFTINGQPFDDTYYLIYVSTMRTSAIAKGYVDEVVQSAYLFGTVKTEDRDVMIISAVNFRSFLKQRDKNAYQYFYQSNYK